MLLRVCLFAPLWLPHVVKGLSCRFIQETLSEEETAASAAFSADCLKKSIVFPHRVAAISSEVTAHYSQINLHSPAETGCVQEDTSLGFPLTCGSSSFSSSLSSQIRGHGSKDHHGKDLWLHLLSEWGSGHRSARSRHRLQLQPDLPPEPESREETSAEGEDFFCTTDLFPNERGEGLNVHTSAVRWEEMFVHKVC